MKKDAENAEFWFGFSDEQALLRQRNIIDKLDMLSELCIKKKRHLIGYNHPKTTMPV